MTTVLNLDEPNDIAEQAAEWMVALSEGTPEQQAAQRRAFEAWKQADPRHAAAAKQIEQFLAPLIDIPDTDKDAANKALKAGLREQSKQRHKDILTKTLLLIVFVSLPLAALLQSKTFSYLAADISASTGSWQTHTLPDGSALKMAGKGAVDLHFSDDRRVVELHGGEIYVDVAADKHRPFIVTTDNGRIEALGTRFIVNHHDDTKTRLSMIESRVRVDANIAPGESKSVEVNAGQKTAFSTAGLEKIGVVDVNLLERRWQNRQLSVQNWSLDEVLAELGRFHVAFMLYDANELKSIKVSATLPLDRPEQALALLASSFPEIRVRHYSSWLVKIDRIHSASK